MVWFRGQVCRYLCPLSSRAKIDHAPLPSGPHAVSGVPRVPSRASRTLRLVAGTVSTTLAWPLRALLPVGIRATCKPLQNEPLHATLGPDTPSIPLCAAGSQASRVPQQGVAWGPLSVSSARAGVGTHLFRHELSRAFLCKELIVQPVHGAFFGRVAAREGVFIGRLALARGGRAMLNLWMIFHTQSRCKIVTSRTTLLFSFCDQICPSIRK